MPSIIIKNKVVGIYYEQKVDYVSQLNCNRLIFVFSERLILLLIDNVLWTLFGVYPWDSAASYDTRTWGVHQGS
jgi:hypothetical protein